MKISAHLNNPDVYSVTINTTVVLNLDYKTPQAPSLQLPQQQP